VLELALFSRVNLGAKHSDDHERAPSGTAGFRRIGRSTDLVDCACALARCQMPIGRPNEALDRRSAADPGRHARRASPGRAQEGRWCRPAIPWRPLMPSNAISCT